MKNILLSILVTLFVNGPAFADLTEFKFNHDVFRCGQEVKFIFELEKNAGVYEVDAEGIDFIYSTFEEAVKETANELEKVSPLRAAFFREIADPLNTKFQYRKKIQLIRSSPVSNIIAPEGCIVEPLSVSAFDDKINYNITINQNLFDRLSVEGKIYFFLSLSLDLQQVFIPNLYSNELGRFSMDLVSSREFLACWFNKKCRPNTVGEFHKLVRKKNYNFKYFEQDHMIALSDRGWGEKDILFDEETGLIVEMKYPVESLTRAPSVLSSSYVFRNKRIMFKSSLGSSKIKFNREGKVNCAPIIKSIKLQAINEGRDIGLLNFCWGNDDQITSGHLMFGPVTQTDTKDYYTFMSDQKVTLSSVSTFALTDDEKIRWVTSSSGFLNFNGQTVHLSGFLEVYPSGKVRCIQVGRETNLRLPNGQRFKIPLQKDMDFSEVHCFKEDGNFLGIDKSFRWIL